MSPPFPLSFTKMHYREIFWSPVPILFYFREVNSIHFLPMLFQSAALRTQLETRLPQLAANGQQSA
jgi:hypothetical protein